MPKRKKGVCTNASMSASELGSEYSALARDLADTNDIILAMQQNPEQVRSPEYLQWIAVRNDLMRAMAKHPFDEHRQNCPVCRFVIETTILRNVVLDAVTIN